MKEEGRGDKGGDGESEEGMKEKEETWGNRLEGRKIKKKRRNDLLLHYACIS